MTKTHALLAAALLTLGACNAVQEDITGPTSKAAARAVVAPVVANQVPGAVGTALTECILDNATEAELVRMSAANAGAPSAEITLLVSDILARDETVACASNSLTPMVDSA